MVDISVIVAVDGDAHIIEKNIFHDSRIMADPRVLDEVSGTAGIFMDGMVDAASSYVGTVCPKIAALKNERTMKIFCEAVAEDEDSWACTIFATESTLPIVLDACDCDRLFVVAPHRRNADFSFRKWRLLETNSYLSKEGEYNPHDIMIYEPAGKLDVSESEMEAELDRLCGEMDSDVSDPATEKDIEAIEKVLSFVKDGLTADDSYMGAFDNDYDDEMDPDDMMDRMAGYVDRSLKGYAPMSLFQRALGVQNDALKRLNGVDDRVGEVERAVDSLRSGLADTSSVCGEGVRRELETVNLKYNSVNERLDGLQTQLGRVVAEDVMRNRWERGVPLALGALALVAAVAGIIL
jgi:hypothetical protein